MLLFFRDRVHNFREWVKNIMRTVAFAKKLFEQANEILGLPYFRYHVQWN